MSTVLPPPPPDADELLLAGAPAAALLLLLELLLLPHAASRSSDPTIRHTLIAFARTLIKVVLLMVDRAVSALDCGRVVARSDRNNLEIAVWRPRAAPLTESKPLGADGATRSCVAALLRCRAALQLGAPATSRRRAGGRRRTGRGWCRPRRSSRCPARTGGCAASRKSLTTTARLAGCRARLLEDGEHGGHRLVAEDGLRHGRVAVGAAEGGDELPAGRAERARREARRRDVQVLLGGGAQTGDEGVVIQRGGREQLGRAARGGRLIERPGGAARRCCPRRRRRRRSRRSRRRSSPCLPAAARTSEAIVAP